jgi:hypothetical protein
MDSELEETTLFSEGMNTVEDAEELLLKPESADELELEDPSDPIDPLLGLLTLNDTSLSLSAENISNFSLEFLLRFRYLLRRGIIYLCMRFVGVKFSHYAFYIVNVSTHCFIDKYINVLCLDIDYF